jgi:hypothetical protein
MVAHATGSAAREAREAKAVTKAARSLAQHPGKPLPPASIKADMLTSLRAEQEKIVQEIEASESADPQSRKGLHQSSRGAPRI